MKDNIMSYDFIMDVKNYVRKGYDEKEFDTIDGVVIDFIIINNTIVINRWYSIFIEMNIDEFMQTDYMEIP